MYGMFFGRSKVWMPAVQRIGVAGCAFDFQGFGFHCIGLQALVWCNMGTFNPVGEKMFKTNSWSSETDCHGNANRFVGNREHSEFETIM